MGQRNFRCWSASCGRSRRPHFWQKYSRWLSPMFIASPSPASGTRTPHVRRLYHADSSPRISGSEVLLCLLQGSCLALLLKGVLGSESPAARRHGSALRAGQETARPRVQGRIRRGGLVQCHAHSVFRRWGHFSSGVLPIFVRPFSASLPFLPLVTTFREIASSPARRRGGRDSVGV